MTDKERKMSKRDKARAAFVRGHRQASIDRSKVRYVIKDEL